MLRRIILPILFLVLATGSAYSSTLTGNDIYHNTKYGWRISVPAAISRDEASSPESVGFKLGSGGLITIESDLPYQFFYDSPASFDIITRLMNFATDSLETSESGNGDTRAGLYYEDMEYVATSGSDEINGYIRLYLGPNGVALCYRDGKSDYKKNLDAVKKFADTLYFPTLDELMEEGKYEMIEFTNPAYGYRLEYPSMLNPDDVWSYISFSFLNEPIIDVHAEARLDDDPAAMLAAMKQESIDEMSGYDYVVSNESSGEIVDGISYIDFTVDDQDEARWLKRVRIIALPKAAVRFEIYCSGEQFDTRSGLLDIMLDTFDFDQQWITEEDYIYYDFPVDALWDSGSFNWADIQDDAIGFTLTVPDFLAVDKFTNLIFLNYGFETIITIITEEHAGMDEDASLAEGERAAEEDFAVQWDYTRNGDVSGETVDGYPYTGFYLNDNDPEANWTKRVRVIGLNGWSVRIEMYLSPAMLDELSVMFDKVADSFKYE